VRDPNRIQREPEVIHIAFIGAGGIAGTHAGAIDATKIKISAVVDLNPDAARTLAEPHGARAFASIDELLDAIDGGLEVDAVLLATPPSARLGVLEQTAARGLHALIEKPLATTVEEAEKIDDLAAAHPGLVFAVGFCHRFAPAIRRMRELAASGKAGRLIRLENTFAFHHPPMAEKWFSDPAVSGGGALLDAGCHSIDLFHFVVGPAEPVGAVFDSPWPGRGESGATTLLRCSEGPHAGAAGVIVSGWMEGERFDVRLIGDAGTLEYDYMKPDELVFRPVGGEPETIAIEPHDLRFAKQLAHFAGCCENPSDDRSPMAGTGEGVAAARTIAGAMGAVSV
jgi:predicted dehydrogenase